MTGSYLGRGSHLQFFMPVAALAAGAITVLEAVDIGASSGDHGEMICVIPCEIVAVGFVPVAEAVSGTSVAPKLVFTKRPTPGSATSESVVATISITTGAAIGSYNYSPLTTRTAFEPGDSLEVAWVIGTGTPTGIGHWFALFDPAPVNPVLATGYVAGTLS